MDCCLCHKRIEGTDTFTLVDDIGILCIPCMTKIKGYMDRVDWTPQDEVDTLMRGLGMTKDNNTEFVEPKTNSVYGSGKLKVGEKCLTTAMAIINGNRQNDYGTPEDSFQRIADYWNSYLFHRKDMRLESKDVAMMMVLFKIARLENGYTHDSCVDICGYTAIYDSMFDTKE